MHEKTLSTYRLSDLMYTPVTTVHQFMAKAEIQTVLPEPAPNGCARQFNERRSMLMMIAADMVRSGIKFPLAARSACRIAEQLLFDPEAPRIHIVSSLILLEKQLTILHQKKFQQTVFESTHYLSKLP